MMSLKKNLLCVTLVVCLILPGLLPSQAKAATDEELLAQIAELTKMLQELQSKVVQSNITSAIQNSDSFIFPVVYDETNESIQFLQEILATDEAIYPEGIASGYFGELTKAAISKFQSSFGLPVSGEFTYDTESVLNSALSTIAFANYPTSYLKNADVRQNIKDSVGGLTLKDTVVDGKVVLNAKPIFSSSQKSSDTATIQRILMTDPISYRITRVTGLMDTTTIFDLIDFRQNYGIAYTSTSNEVPALNDVLDSQTISLFKKILQVNGADVIKDDLLLQKEVSPSVLIPNSTRVLSEIKAVRDYRANNTAVSVHYKGGMVEEFTTSVVSPNRAVASAIATKLGRPLASISTVIKHDSIYAKDFKKILLKIYLSSSMTIYATYLDGTTDGLDVSSFDIENFVQYAYQGNYNAYQSDFDLYVEKARKGEDISMVYNLIGSALGKSPAEVKAVLEINVDQYSSYFDPCGTGACGGF